MKRKCPEQAPSQQNPLKQNQCADSSSPTVPQTSEGFIKIPHARPRITPATATVSAPVRPESAADLFTALSARFRAPRRTREDLINAESRLGSQLFGPIPEGHRREFFHDRENIWIWHEGWTDADAQPRQLTIRYEVRPSGVYKKVAAGYYLRLEGGELENFRRAAHLYLDVIKANLYS